MGVGRSMPRVVVMVVLLCVALVARRIATPLLLIVHILLTPHVLRTVGSPQAVPAVWVGDLSSIRDPELRADVRIAVRVELHVPERP